MLSKKIKGNIFEAKACDFLIKNGYKIIKKNYTNLLGEIDIIASKDNYIVFVEVKGKYSAKFGRPIEMINQKKINKIRSVATFYLKTHKQLDSNVRFDVIEVFDEDIRHIINCF